MMGALIVISFFVLVAYLATLFVYRPRKEKKNEAIGNAKSNTDIN